MKHQPTFKPSPARRPLYRRLTPLAWAFISLGVLVVVLVLVGVGVACTARPSEEPWRPTVTAEVVSTATPVLPTPTPTAWYEGMVSPTPEPTAAYPAWWSDRMTQDENGQWWPPEEVVEMVRQHFRECDDDLYSQYIIETKPPDLDGYEREVIPYCTIGEYQARRYSRIQGVRDGIDTLSWAEWEHGCFYQVQDWSEDGLECTVGQTCSNGTAYEYDNAGNLVKSEHRDYSGLILWRMRYDPSDGRWKKARLIEWIPPQ